MSKEVKELMMNQFSRRLEGVDDCVLVNVIGLDANASVGLRRRLREKDISLLVVKKALVRRATEGTKIGAAFTDVEGSIAVCWGAEDFVSLVKEVTLLDKDEEDFEVFATRGGVMDGEALTPERVNEISKWPSRQEQLSTLAGQILGPGSTLAAQLTGPGGSLAGQVKSKSEE